MPGRFELGVARRDGTLEDVLNKVAGAMVETNRCVRKSLTQLAMEASCTTSREDAKTFSVTMVVRDPNACREVIYRFDSERRAGEFARIRNLPALLTQRLTALPATR